MRILVLLALFGLAGTLCRFGLEGWVQNRVGPGFPLGTLAVNLLGCLLLGAIGQFALNHIGFSPELRIAITVGFCGAFTTFSTFGWETVRMMQDGEWYKAGTYVIASVVGGLAALAAGMRLGSAI